MFVDFTCYDSTPCKNVQRPKFVSFERMPHSLPSYYL